MNRIAKSLCILTSVVLAGCSGVPVKLGSVTDATQFDRNKGEELEASASGVQLLWLIPAGINDRQQRAYEEIKRLAGDRVLTDVKVGEKWTYIFVGTAYTTTIRATAYPKLPQK